MLLVIIKKNRDLLIGEVGRKKKREALLGLFIITAMLPLKKIKKLRSTSSCLIPITGEWGDIWAVNLKQGGAADEISCSHPCVPQRITLVSDLMDSTAARTPQIRHFCGAWNKLQFSDPEISTLRFRICVLS